MMPIRLVLADDSDVMRPAIVRLLKDEPRIELVGEATSFAETLQLAAGLKPDVLLLDLHMRDEREYPPELVKSQILLHTKCIVAISLYNDDARGRRPFDTFSKRFRNFRNAHTGAKLLYRGNQFRIKLHFVQEHVCAKTFSQSGKAA
jgi:CheY-like chemotaxis protein